VYQFPERQTAYRLWQYSKSTEERSQWPFGLRSRSTAARLLRSWVLIPPRAWMFAVCCVLSGRGLCDELIARSRGVLPTMARRCVRSRNLVIRGVHSPRWAGEPEKQTRVRKMDYFSDGASVQCEVETIRLQIGDVMERTQISMEHDISWRDYTKKEHLISLDGKLSHSRGKR
jgi:endonuclease YncB( thermonuclease family)